MISGDGYEWTLVLETPSWTRPRIEFCLDLVPPSCVQNNRAHLSGEAYQGPWSRYLSLECYLKIIILGFHLTFPLPQDWKRRQFMRWFTWPKWRR